MNRKKKDLQPWIDCFKMLAVYEEKGFLQMAHDQHEAYVTQPALHAMTEGSNPQQQLASGAILHTVRNLRAYAAWLSRDGEKYLKQNFAVHVVKPEEPHDLLYTVLLTHCRPWWNGWVKRERVETIRY